VVGGQEEGTEGRKNDKKNLVLPLSEKIKEFSVCMGRSSSRVVLKTLMNL